MSQNPISGGLWACIASVDKGCLRLKIRLLAPKVDRVWADWPLLVAPMSVKFSLIIAQTVSFSMPVWNRTHDFDIDKNRSISIGKRLFEAAMCPRVFALCGPLRVNGSQKICVNPLLMVFV